MNEVDYAIMEVSGDVSVLPKSKYKPLTPSDMKIETEETYLECIAIIDGKIMKNNLRSMFEYADNYEKINTLNDYDIFQDNQPMQGSSL